MKTFLQQILDNEAVVTDFEYFWNTYSNQGFDHIFDGLGLTFPEYQTFTRALTNSGISGGLKAAEKVLQEVVDKRKAEKG